MLNIFKEVALFGEIEWILFIFGLVSVVKMLKNVSKIRGIIGSLFVIIRYIILSMIVAFVLFKLYTICIPPPTTTELVVIRTKVVTRVLVELDKNLPLHSRLVVRILFPYFDVLNLIPG